MKPVDEEELKASIAKVISEIEKEHRLEQIEQKSSDVFIKTDKENDYIQQILDETKLHYSEKISIEIFSDRFGVSSSYLSRKFKESTGTSYLDFLNKYRVQQAVKLLETGKYKVYEVSDLTGFSDYKHFNTVFKRYTGSSPSEFVK
jgi:two-component system response regulator YesN